eukprot:gene4784-6709_t
MNKKLLTDIPPHLNCVLLSQWLNLIDLSNLDCATRPLMKFICKPADDPSTFISSYIKFMYSKGSTNRYLTIKGLEFDCNRYCQSYSIYLKWLCFHGLVPKFLQLLFNNSDVNEQYFLKNFFGDSINNQCRSIRSIHLNNFIGNISTLELENQLKIIFTRCSNIINLQLMKWYHNSEIIDNLIEFIPIGLIRLEISYSRNMKTSTILNLLQPLSNLTSLSLKYIDQLTDDGLKSIIKLDSISQLKHLRISNCTLISDSSITLIPYHMNKLITFHIVDCIQVSGNCYKSLSKLSSTLTSLRIAPFNGITDLLPQLVNISSLSLVSSRNQIYFRNVNLNFDDLFRLCDKLHIITLDLTGYRLINDNHVKLLSENYYNLKFLSLRGCDDITDASIITLVNNCLKIQVLDIGHCGKITDISIAMIAHNLLELQHISLDYCRKITDIGVSQFLSMNDKSKLLSINTTGCNQVNDMKIKEMQCASFSQFRHHIQLSTAYYLNPCWDSIF